MDKYAPPSGNDRASRQREWDRRDRERPQVPGPPAAEPPGGVKPARGAIAGPDVDPDATLDQLDWSVQKELSSLPASLLEKVASHLVMAGRLMDEDPDLAVQHARQAHDLSPRIPAVREALAIAAYGAGDYKTALREARTVRRMSGDDSWLPMIADCERGLGRSDRALDLLLAVNIGAMPIEIRAECLIVMAGARRDLGQDEAALAILDTDLLRSRKKSEWVARMRVTYADTLTALGRGAEADRWLRLAAASDPSGASGAANRLVDADELEFVDTSEDFLQEMPSPGLPND